jgi:hypothetical protein
MPSCSAHAADVIQENAGNGGYYTRKPGDTQALELLRR